MFKTCKAALGAAVLAVGLAAGTAQAGFITGSISVSDGIAPGSSQVRHRRLSSAR